MLDRTLHFIKIHNLYKNFMLLHELLFATIVKPYSFMPKFLDLHKQTVVDCASDGDFEEELILHRNNIINQCEGDVCRYLGLAGRLADKTSLNEVFQSARTNGELDVGVVLEHISKIEVDAELFDFKLWKEDEYNDEKH